MGFATHQPKKTLRRFLFLKLFFIIILVSSLLSNLIHYSILGGKPELIDFISAFLLLVPVALTYFIRDAEVTRVTAKVKVLMDKNKQKEAERLIERKLGGFLGLFRINWLALKAMFLVKKGEMEKGDKILDDILKKYPNFQTALYYKACLENKKENKQKALYNLEKSFKVLQKIYQQKKNPLSKFIIKKRAKNFLSAIRTDEDLSSLNETKEYEKLLSRINELLNK